MKKLWVLGLLVVLVALLPFIGNQVVKNTIEERLEVLSQNGLEAKLEKEKKSYLTTKLHYTITVKDEEKFLEYLQSFSSKELPPYTKSLLEGVVFAVDIRYSNIPFSEKISIDLYPLKLSDKAMENLKRNDPEIFAFLSKLLKEKVLLYHIDYDITTGEFQGHMRDLNERLTTKNDTNVSLVFEGVEASGKGMLLAPDALQMKVKRIALSMSNKISAVRFDIQNLLTTNSFESRTTYTVSSKVASAKLSVHTVRNNPATMKPVVEDLQLQLKNFALNASSDTQGADAALYAKASFDELRSSQNSQSIVLKGFNYDSSLTGIQKESFVKLQQLVEKSSNMQSVTPKIQQELEAILIKMFAHGMEIKIADFSLRKLSTPEVDNIDGFAISMLAKLKSDPTFVQNYKQHPDVFVQNLSIVSDIRLSKPFYALVNKVYPVEIMFGSYKKEQGENVLFHIEFQGGHISINGKKVQ